MIVDEFTKISSVIQENELAIDAIASINKHFLKLKNPVLRKILASRVSIADAAKIGGVTPLILLNKLRDIGFTVRDQDGNPGDKNPFRDEERIISVEERFLAIELDVRDKLMNGEDPFSLIHQTLKKLGPDETLKLVNSFAPTPLIDLMKQRGYLINLEKVEDDLYNTYFKKTALTELESETLSKRGNKEAIGDETILFDEIQFSFGTKLERINVRELEMPEPMIQILNRLNFLQQGNALLVEHKKIPHFLFPELQQRNFLWVVKVVSESDVQLLIYRK